MNYNNKYAMKGIRNLPTTECEQHDRESWTGGWNEEFAGSAPGSVPDWWKLATAEK